MTILKLLASSCQLQEGRHPSMLLAGILGRTGGENADKRPGQ
ncbi:hypothetical protein [Vibrio breoganii]|nr:hypothetical protein [Vibrio breoganii]